MSGDLYQIETRRRSRSNTPFLRSSCDHENCEHLGEEGHAHHGQRRTAAPPNVQTIVEEAVVVTSSSASPVKISAMSASATNSASVATQEASSRSKTKSMATSMTTTTSSSSSMSTTTVINKSKRTDGHALLGGNSRASTSTPKANFLVQSFAAQFSSSGTEADAASLRPKEVAQNEINTAFERSQQHEASGSKNNNSKRKSNHSFSHILGNSLDSDQSSGALDTSDHLAYMEYKRAGEYWKTTPKTDYTYSELSPHRRVLAPGVVAMPNMSRRSLENHHDRINYMVERDPEREEFIRRRYEASHYAQNRKASEKLFYDSADEYDYAYSGKYSSTYKQSSENLSWFMRIITTIVTSVTTVWSTVTGAGAGAGGGVGARVGIKDGLYDSSSLHYRQYAQEKRGFFGSIAHAIAAPIIALFSAFYSCMSYLMCWETWALMAPVAGRNRKRAIFFFLLLLPLLLLAAYSLLDANNRTYYLQRTQALLPLSLGSSLRATLYSIGASFKGLLNLSALKIMNISHRYNPDQDAQIRLQNVEQKIQKALTAEEYGNILNHVNSYVQQLVDLKMQQQRAQFESKAQHITAEQTQVIVQLMRENLERVTRERRDSDQLSKLAAFSDEEVERLALLVQQKFESRGWTVGQAPVQLTADNLAEITRLIGDHIEVNNHAHYKLLVEQIDLEALLGRIFSAPQLAQLIDARISFVVGDKLSRVAEGSGAAQAASGYKQQQHLINELNKEIAFIKLALSDKISENEDMHQSISRLQLGQDDLLKRIQEHELSTDKRFSVLLAEIDSKLAALNDNQFVLMNKQIKLSLVEILGFKHTSAAGAQLEDIDLQHWVRNMFVAKEYLEERLLQLNDRTNDLIKEEIDRSGMVLMRDISERLKREILLSVEAKQNESTAALKGQIRAALSEEEVQNIVKSVLAIYDADKTGLVDFALESAGGQILSTRCTESYQTKTAQLSVFGIPLWYPTNTPRVAISPNVQPGECWAFQGFPGFLVLKLNSFVYVTGFTLEHIPKTLSPNGHIDSAPRNFTVWGLEHEKDQEPILFGEYEYVDNDASLQYFPLQNKNIKRPYEIVEIRIESNHGHPQYTCLYRFRVHGKPPSA